MNITSKSIGSTSGSEIIARNYDMVQNISLSYKNIGYDINHERGFVFKT